jgi:hypothetical protein
MNDLTVNFSHLERETILEDWRWLIGPTKQPILLAAIGDAYVQDPDDDTVHLLDVGAGALELIADSVEEFQELLGDSEFVTGSFVPQIVVNLRNAGKPLEAGQIYSYEHPPVLGGEYSVENMVPTDISVHFSVLGQIHRQVKDLPEGTSISEVKIEVPEG